MKPTCTEYHKNEELCNCYYHRARIKTIIYEIIEKREIKPAKKPRIIIEEE